MCRCAIPRYWSRWNTKPGWPVDFINDATACGCRFHMFKVVFDFNRKTLSIEIDLNLPALQMVRVLDSLAAKHSYLVM